MKNLDENVLLNTSKCILTLLSKEEGAQDVFIRHRGILTLKNCAVDVQ